MGYLVGFLARKFRGTSILKIFRSQFELLVCWPFNGIPSLPGFILRFIVCKIFAKRIHGFIWIQPRVEIVDLKNIEFGRNCGVNTGSYLNGLGGIQIGSNVLIGSNVTISSGRHPIDGIDGEIFENPSIPLPITIEDGVWIGAGAVIMPGIILGRGCVIGANAVVTKSTDPCSVYAGVPARLIRKRDVRERS